MHTNEQFKAIHELRDLLADSRKHYRATAKRVDDPAIKGMMLEVAEQRAVQETELNQDLVQHDPAVANGTAAGTIYRVLLTFRDVFNDTSDVNVLVECERQEVELRGRYAAVLDSADLTESTRATLARQMAENKRLLERVWQAREQIEQLAH